MKASAVQSAMSTHADCGAGTGASRPCELSVAAMTPVVRKMPDPMTLPMTSSVAPTGPIARSRDGWVIGDYKIMKDMKKTSLLLGMSLLAATVAARPPQTPQAPEKVDKAEALAAAARKGDAAAVTKLLEDGVDVNTKFRYGTTALSFAADHGHLEGFARRSLGWSGLGLVGQQGSAAKGGHRGRNHSRVIEEGTTVEHGRVPRRKVMSWGM